MDKPETTPSGSAPQNDGAANSGVKRKIAGKFDSLEEAVEKGYVGLETEFHSMKGEVLAVKKLLEDALSSPDPQRGSTVPVGQSGGDDNSSAYGRGDELKIDPAQFLANPGQVIKQVEDRAYARAMKSSADLIANAMVVQEFKIRNQDLVQHEALVSSFLQKTDPNKPLNKRLEDAAKETRTYLGNLKAEWTGESRTPSEDEFVEAPSGERGQRKPSNDQEKDETLDEYVRGRHMERARHFGTITKK